MPRQALQGHTPPYLLHVLPPRNRFHYISSRVEETEAVMQRERLKLVSSFHPLPLQICLVTEPSASSPPVWGLQGGRSAKTAER